MSVSSRTLCVAVAFAAAIAVPSANANQSRDGVWTDVDMADLERSGAVTLREIMPTSYRSLTIDQAALDRALTFAPSESQTPVKDSGASIQLPLPDGRFEEFRIVESSVMAPELAARYPQIQSWLGQGIDDPSATVRLDRSPKGFHAQIISWRGTILIDPLAPGDSARAIVYHKRDAQRQGPRPVCSVTGQPLPEDMPNFSKRGVVPKLVSGETLRTHRLAVAATGEYTQFHGGTVLDGLAAINTTITRINGIYERDLALRLEIVANNDEIIYTNGGTDPYTNNSGGAMLGQNQSNLDAMIGSANYDIGHVVSTGGGGVVSGRVCTDGSKARGVTGQGSPIGDVFDVDFVAHEMGHQYTGSHPYNGAGCSAGQRVASAAYEPGSAITIMGYAGICGPDNLQANSESYFHRISLNQIIDFITTGGGSNCGTTSATGNTPPTVTTDATFTIPQLTPFTLTAAGDDLDGDPLTYIWEQFDLGDPNAAGNLVDDGNRPIFRGFTPQLDASRTFPSWRYILNNANDVPSSAPVPGTTSPNRFTGEVLPSTNRALNFRVTVRDNRPMGGGTNEALTTLTVTTAAGPFRVTAPNTAITAAANSSVSVTWDVSGTDIAPVSVPEVAISISLDGGLTWPFTYPPTANDGELDVTLPDGIASTRARIRVASVGNVFFDVSDVDFEITGTNSQPTVTVNGEVNTRQGSPTASAPVASINDVQDAAGTLAVAIEGMPIGLAASVQNNAGDVSLSATAQCTLVAPTNGVRPYPLTLRVTDSAGAETVAEILVNVARNQHPELGTYADTTLGAGNTTQVSPASPVNDPNDNFDEVTVAPATLPGGGTVSVDVNGVVSVTADASTPMGDYLISVTAIDTCGAQETRQFTVSVSDTLFEDGFE